MSENPPPTIVVTTKNTPSLVLGIIGIVVGVFALLVGWVPILGLLTIPAALIGLILAGVGVVIALVKAGKGIGLPLLGCAISVCAIVLPLLTTGGFTAAIKKAQERSRFERQSTATQKQLQTSETSDEKATYIQSSLELYEIEAKYRESILNGKVPGVLFKLRNKGERQLDMVKVTVYFKDNSGATIFEQDFHPVLVSELSLSDSKPLKAGYIWQMESGKFYTAKSVPAEWKEGSVEAKVTDIRFAKGS